MLPKPILLPRLDAVRLRKLMSQPQENRVDTMLKFHRVVKGASSGQPHY
jgi:hypothetical protein